MCDKEGNVLMFMVSDSLQFVDVCNCSAFYILPCWIETYSQILIHLYSYFVYNPQLKLQQCCVFHCKISFNVINIIRLRKKCLIEKT